MLPNKGRGIFYGWYIVFVAFIANFMSIGTSFYILNAFMEPLCNARGWTRTDVNLALVIGTICGAFGQFLYGILVIRIGPRILMLVCSIIAGNAFILIGQTHSLAYFYLFYAILFFGNGGYGGIVANTVVNNWFIRKRGSALGLASAGQSLSGAILPFVAMVIIIGKELDDAFWLIGLIIMCVGPLSWLIVRNWPESYGLTPDGIQTDNLQETSKDKVLKTTSEKSIVFPKNNIKDKRGSYLWTLPLLVRNGAFWRLGIGYALALIGVVGVMSQLKPYFKDIGFGDMTAMGMMAATALIGTIGKYFWGRMCDRFDPRSVVAVLLLANGVGLTMVFFHHFFLMLILFIIVFGFAVGGVWTTYPIVIAELFGRQSFPTVSRFLSFFLVFELTGYIIAGQSFDRMGSYDPAYVVFILSFFISAFLIFSTKKPLVNPNGIKE